MTLVKAAAIDHIDLSVGDLPRSIAFYDAVLTALGFRRLPGDETIIWRGSQTELAIRAATSPGPSSGYDRYRVGLHHLAFRADSRDAVDRFHAFLLQKGFEVLDPPAEYPDYGGGYYAVFFADPDGMKLELVHRTWD